MFNMISTRINTFVYPPLLISTDSNNNGTLVRVGTSNIFTFTGNGSVSFRTHDGLSAPPANNYVHYFIVGGGGGGGAATFIVKDGVYNISFGSGGGGGEFIEDYIDSRMSLCGNSSSQSVSVILGDGGKGEIDNSSYTFPESEGEPGGVTKVFTSEFLYTASGGFAGTAFFGGHSGKLKSGGFANPDSFTGGAGGGSDSNYGGVPRDSNGAKGGDGYIFPRKNDYVYMGGGGGGGSSAFAPTSIAGEGGIGGGGRGGNAYNNTAGSNGNDRTGGGGGGGGSKGGTGGTGTAYLWVNI